MQSQDLEILQQTARWLKAGKRPWLCTITATLGSSPRPVGTMLSYCEGVKVGTLSGGCVEEDLLARLDSDEIARGGPEQVEYGVTAEDNERLGLPCGGRLEILVERLDPAGSDWVPEAEARLRSRKLVARRVELATGTTTLAAAKRHGELQIEDGLLVQTLGPKMRMLLVGAGQLAQVLSTLAIAMDFDVLATDPRDAALAAWTGPDIPLIQGLPDDVIAAQAVDEHTLIITLTHDPRIDDMALMEALESEAWYVGALGSLRTTEARLARLEALGLDAEKLARLHAPVGLSIGSKTPWEIAVAIMAEITRERRVRAD